jgi:UDP-glucuronate 4-epimerase
MALFVFADAIVRGNPIKLFNGGRMLRDFTCIDVTEALVRLIDRVPRGEPCRLGEALDPGSSTAPWCVYNVGNNKPEELLRGDRRALRSKASQQPYGESLGR